MLTRFFPLTTPDHEALARTHELRQPAEQQVVCCLYVMSALVILVVNGCFIES